MSSGGRETELFCGEVDEYLVCSICQCVLVDPVDTPCRHNFCGSCIRRHIASDKRCPIDRESLVEKDLRKSIVFLTNTLGKLVAKCDHCREGCPWTGAWQSLDVHPKNCDFVSVKCEWKECAFISFRKDAAGHAETCCHKQEPCKFCGTTVTIATQAVHHAVCQEFPSECSCGSVFPRKTANEHDQVCPNTIVPCCLQPFGCSLTFPRSKTDSHALEYINKHMIMMVSRVQVANNKIEVCEAEILKLNKRLALSLNHKGLEMSSILTAKGCYASDTSVFPHGSYSLVFRGSRDGYRKAAFEEKLKGITGKCLVLVSTTDGKIFGGLTSALRRGDIQDKSAVLVYNLGSGWHKISLKQGQTGQFIFSKHEESLVSFGPGDLEVLSDTCTNNSSSYWNGNYLYSWYQMDSPQKTNFQVKELEVFVLAS